jgi:hypothetical protein
MGLIEDGLALLNETLTAEASIEVVYRRDDVPIAITAVPTKPFFVPVTGSAPPDPARPERNYSVMASDLVIDDVPIQPITTDEIIETIDGIHHVYRVANPQNGFPCWEFESGYMQNHPLARILIHCKYVGTEI